MLEHQSDLRYAYSSYQSKLISVMAVRLEMDDVQVKRAIQSAGERMGHAKVKRFRGYLPRFGTLNFFLCLWIFSMRAHKSWNGIWEATSPLSDGA